MKSILMKAIRKFEIKEPTVLDLGCGIGRDTIVLADKGYKVLAVDKSQDCLDKMTTSKLKAISNVKTLNIDITNFDFSLSKFDLILCMNVLHFLNKESIKKVIDNMKTSTNDSGMNVISVFTEENPNKNLPGLFKKEELKELYNDWNIVHYDEYFSPFEQHDGSEVHQHHIAEIIAIKNNHNLKGGTNNNGN